MFSISAYETPSRRELRSFGFILAGGFSVMAFLPTLLRSAQPRWWIFFLGIVFAAAGAVVPGLLGPVHRTWTLVGNILGWVNSRIILSLIFYLIVTPVRVVMALSGKDAMRRKFDGNAETYRVVRKGREPSHMKHQF